MHRSINTSRGFTALITVIVISGIISSMLLVSSITQVSLEHQITLTESKEKSYYRARSCSNYAILKAQEDALYEGNETITLTTGQCTIHKITHEDRHLKITTSATDQEIQTNLIYFLNLFHE